MKILNTRLLFTAVFVFLAGITSSQVLFSDDFESGSANWVLNAGGTGDNAWIVNNAYTASLFTSTPNQPVGITNAPNSNYLHIHNLTVCGFGFDCQAVFDAGSSSNQTATMATGINTIGQTNVTLSFWYLCNGAAGFTYGFVEYSTNNGATWTSATPNYSGVSGWTQETLTNPAWDGQASLMFRWHWINGPVGNDPAFAVDDIEISVPNSPQAITTDNVSILSWCEGASQSIDVDFTATGTYNTGNTFTAELSDATGSFATPTTIGTLNSSTSGSQTINCVVPAITPSGTNYRVRVVSSNPVLIGSDNGLDISIYTQPSAPLVGTITQPTCLLNTGSVNLNGLPSSGTYNIIGTPGPLSQTSSGTSFNFSNLTANTNYTFTVTDNNGCVSAPSANVAIDPIPAGPSAPTTNVISQPTCATPTGSFEVTSPLGANFEYSIGSGNQASPTFSGLNPNTYTVTVTDLNTGCVSNSASVTIDPIANGPQITLQASSDVSCAGAGDGQATITVTGGSAPYTYNWQPGGSTTASATGLSGGNYTVTVIDALGCASTQTVTIAEPSAIVLSEIVVDSDCANPTGAIDITSTGGSGTLSYAWDSGQTTEDLSGISAGTYTLTVSDANGCSTQGTYIVDQTGGLIINVTPSQALIEAGESVQLNATGAQDYTWTPSASLSCSTCSDPIATPTLTTNYTVIGVDANGCSGQTTVLITVSLNCTDFFVPTAFSPDGNSVNDLLCVYGNCISELNYAVYDRWGKQLFQTADPVECWDGTVNGTLVQSGVYVYKVNATLFDGTTIQDAGNLKIVR